MAIRPLILAGFLVLLTVGASNALVSTENLNPPASKAISDLKDAIVKVLGFKGDEFKISGFDIRDALVGHSVSYEFDIEIDNKILPLKLIEDVNRWEYVDLPIFRAQKSSSQPNDENSLVENRRSEEPVLPVLAPFQLSGPMELWIQDAKDMRLSLPHDVDAGVLKKVILADGAVVTVKGAKSVSLRHPLDLPLPLNGSHGLLTLAEGLRNSARSQSSQLLSLRIVGPTSLTSPSSSSSSNSRLKLKRLAPGLVELSSPSKNKAIKPVLPINEEEEEEVIMDRLATMWPLTSVNGSNSNLRGFETLLHSVLGSKANEEGSFKLLKVEASAQTYVKMLFEVEKELKEGDGVNLEGFPEWKTKPESVTMHFEVLGKVDGEKVVPEKVAPVNPVRLEDNILGNVFTGNMTFTETPIVYPRPDPFTL